jgi:hypothetical protein
LLPAPGGKLVFTGHRSVPGLMHGSDAPLAASANFRQQQAINIRFAFIVIALSGEIES